MERSSNGDDGGLVVQGRRESRAPIPGRFWQGRPDDGVPPHLHDHRPSLPTTTTQDHGGNRRNLRWIFRTTQPEFIVVIVVLMMLLLSSAPNTWHSIPGPPRQLASSGGGGSLLPAMVVDAAWSTSTSVDWGRRRTLHNQVRWDGRATSTARPSWPLRCNTAPSSSSTPLQQYRCTSKFAHPSGDQDGQHEEEPIASTSLATTSTAQPLPQAFASGYSTQPTLLEAIQEAVEMACESLPESIHSAETAPASSMSTAAGRVIDLAWISVSSLYDGGLTPVGSTVVPALMENLQRLGWTVRHLVGSSVAGGIATAAPLRSTATLPPPSVEWEGVPAVQVMFCILPDCHLRTFHVSAADVPNDLSRTSATQFQRAVGLLNLPTTTTVADREASVDNAAPNLWSSNVYFWLLPSPAFGNEMDDLLQGLAQYFPRSQTWGGVASTVSSLSRAKLYQWSSETGSSGWSSCCYTDGCVGVALSGDIAVQSMMAQGAKPVGGIYQILKGQESTISAIVLDETATNALRAEEENQKDDQVPTEDDESEDASNVPANSAAAKAKAAQEAYAKARIPKPPLAEANFVMRALSDDDQAFMRRKLLIGLDRGGSVGRTASDLIRLSQGQGHRFAVHQVASAGMKDGSVTMPLGSVRIEPGTRMRFYVRESNFARKEVEALWTGYKKRLLTQQFQQQDSTAAEGLVAPFQPGACLIIPTLDRGSKFFSGKAGFESSTAAKYLPGIPCIAGFFANGVVGRIDAGSYEGGDTPAGVQGSASGYFLIGSRSGRPIYSPVQAAKDKASREEEEAARRSAERLLAEEEAKRERRTKGPTELDARAPRSEDGELILKRREVHSGRALTVSTVEWSVAEKAAAPTSTLEGFMWDKETEVDRFRERVPLANLVSQCRLSATDPSIPKPRDWIGPVKQAGASGRFVIIPECKRADPMGGSLRKRYDVGRLVRDMTKAGVAALCVNCDGVLFGGSLQDITDARQSSTSAALEQEWSDDGVLVPPILASDLILYPYQLYKLRLAGADATTILVGALTSKDLLYLTKIASSLQLQTVFVVTSTVQLAAVAALPARCFQGLIVSNRELEDFSFDMTGEQALSLLKSEPMRAVRQQHGSDLPILVQGRVGVIERMDHQGQSSKAYYIRELNQAGALGAIVGGGLVTGGENEKDMKNLLQALSTPEI